MLRKSTISTSSLPTIVSPTSNSSSFQQNPKGLTSQQLVDATSLFFLYSSNGQLNQQQLVTLLKEYKINKNGIFFSKKRFIKEQFDLVDKEKTGVISFEGFKVLYHNLINIEQLTPRHRESVKFVDSLEHTELEEKDKDKEKEEKKDKKKKKKSSFTGFHLRHSSSAVPEKEKFVQFNSASTEIPTALYKLIDYIRQNGLDVPGIFRISGIATQIQAIKKMYDAGKLPDLSKYDINDVAGALKLWLRQLPQPLLTFSLYEAFMAATSITESEEERLECIRRVVKRLPKGNLVVLKFLAGFLGEVANESAVNLMSASNLAIVFTPTCFRPQTEAVSIDILFGKSTDANSLFESFITNYNQIFLPRSESHIKVQLKGQQSQYAFGTLTKGAAALFIEQLAENQPHQHQPQPAGASGILSSASLPQHSNHSLVVPVLGLRKISDPNLLQPSTSGSQVSPRRNTTSVQVSASASASAQPETQQEAWHQFFTDPNSVSPRIAGDSSGSSLCSSYGSTPRGPVTPRDDCANDKPETDELCAQVNELLHASELIG
eukprot:TRINITY_DN4399_c0_g9_i1.p1 TRINITY_DN4399_c0_g9~~TRINITY_DN4399_c0_g9_i1.p1  ORF type:complete len:548 (-),score=141.11 TRINITY_DN4399_c0_g9_i1:179-1822(-)